MSGLLRALGLCRKAGALVCGTPMICSALPDGGIFAVYEANDTSEGTHKKLTDKCTYYGVRRVVLNVGGETLAAAVGKTGFLAAVAVKNASLAELCEKAYESDKNGSLNIEV